MLTIFAALGVEAEIIDGHCYHDLSALMELFRAIPSPTRHHLWRIPTTTLNIYNPLIVAAGTHLHEVFTELPNIATSAGRRSDFALLLLNGLRRSIAGAGLTNAPLTIAPTCPSPPDSSNGTSSVLVRKRVDHYSVVAGFHGAPHLPTSAATLAISITGSSSYPDVWAYMARRVDNFFNLPADAMTHARWAADVGVGDGPEIIVVSDVADSHA